MMRVDDGIVMQHFGVDNRPLSNESDKVSKVSIGDIDHGGN
jgi:hypothetical protein